MVDAMKTTIQKYYRYTYELEKTRDQIKKQWIQLFQNQLPDIPLYEKPTIAIYEATEEFPLLILLRIITLQTLSPTQIRRIEKESYSQLDSCYTWKELDLPNNTRQKYYEYTFYVEKIEQVPVLDSWLKD